MKPEEVTFQLLREITNGFSEQRKIGEGSFGVVYKGVTQNGNHVAVKVLKNVYHDVDNEQFENEFDNLTKVKHDNIVQFFAYCYEKQKKSVVHDGITVITEERQRALCFEYLQNGSLQKYLSDDSSELNWHTWYKIIRGVCEGLKHMHVELEEPIYHLDLKPDNILLENNMVPKIADFGISRIIMGEDLTRTTESHVGTHGFQPPEHINNCEISNKFDIFSLGVIIKRILSAHSGYPKDTIMSTDEFIDHIKKYWRNKLQKTWNTESLFEKCWDQVITCIQIWLLCTEENRQKRPNIMEIINLLNETETNIEEESLPDSIDSSLIHEVPHKGCCIAMHTKTRAKPTEMRDHNLEYFDVKEELIVGRKEEKKKIMHLLKSITRKSAILPIYGIGGIGKTTFARMIYNDTYFKSYARVWIDVPRRLDLSEICTSIVSQLSESDNNANGIRRMHTSLAKALAGKNVLIILDDLWEDNPIKLDKLQNILYNDYSKIIVLVTTRNKHVAEKICTNIENPYEIEFLTYEMCWDIIKQRSEFDARDDKEDLSGIGMEIAKKCGGVALAANSLGFMLKSKSSYQWNEVNNSNVWNESISQDTSLPNHVLHSLKISYESMDEYLNLKLCFTYCGIFPKRHKIVKDDLIQQWISLGYIKCTNMKSVIQVSEDYIVQLLGLSFLQHSNPPQTYRPYGEHDIVFTMHDLVHDLAISILRDKILDQSTQGNICTRGRDCEYALLNDCSKPLKESCTASASLRALRFVGCLETQLSCAALAPAESLQVLDLSDCSILKLPDCIGGLKQLRYLNAPRIQDVMVPECITKLSNLMYLNLKGSPAILALPESIGEMESLVHLDLSGCSGIGKLPDSFGDLRNLEYVGFKKCTKVAGVSQCLGRLTKLQYLNLSCCKHIGDVPSALGSLTELQYLNLSYSSYIGMDEDGRVIGELLGSLTKLKYLNLSVSGLSSFRALPEAFGKLAELRYLNLSGHLMLVKLPWSFVKLCNLLHLDLSDCAHIKGVPEALSGLTKLQYLNLFQCSLSVPEYMRASSLEGLRDVLGNLSGLRYLNLRGCLKIIFGDQAIHEGDSLLGHLCTLTDLEYLDLSVNDNLYSLPETLGNLSKLHTLDLSLCTNLQSLPASISEIESLKFLYTLNCWKLDRSTLPQHKNSSVLLPHFVVHSGDAESASSNLFLLEDEDPTSLEISMLENVKSAEEAQRIKLVEKRMIKILEFVWTRDAKRFVDDDVEVLRELEPPSSVQMFRLQGFNSASFPSWITGIVSYLPHLIAVYMVDMPACSSLPPLGQLPNLKLLQIKQMDSIRKIGEDLYGGTGPFRQLENFWIQDMTYLEEWDAPASCGKDDLQRRQMDSSRNIGEEDTKSAFCLPGDLLKEVTKISEELNRAKEISCRAFDRLKWLFVRDCPRLRFKAGPPQGSYCQYRLSITSSDQVVLSPWGHAGAGTSTCTATAMPTSLEVEHCEAPLHQWSLLRHLPHLKELLIKDCTNLTCSSANLLGGLTSLKTLTVQDCESIVALPKRLGDLTALTTLKIGNCKRLKTLPDSIQQLTNLQRLEISACPELGYQSPEIFAHIKEIEIDGQQCAVHIPGPAEVLYNRASRYRGIQRNKSFP